MKVKLFVFSDVHGNLDALQTSLRQAGYSRNDPNHILVSLGDNFDRGKSSRGVYNFLKDRRGVFVRGNHEGFLLEALEKGMDGEFVLFNFLHNGLARTIESFSKYELPSVIQPKTIDKLIDNIRHEFPNLVQWIKDMPLKFETKNYIFVHAGLHPWKKIDDAVNDEHFMLWDIEYSHVPIEGTTKTVVIGHHHAASVRKQGLEEYHTETALGLPYIGNQDENRPVRFGNKIAIDPCSILTNKVNVLVIEDELLDEEQIQKPNSSSSGIKFEGFTAEEVAFNWNTFANATTTTATYYTRG